MLEAIPAASPARSATMPMTHGIRMAPLEATGSMMPMLVTLVMRPALATAVGFSPDMEMAKANSNAMAAPCVCAMTSNM